MCPTTLADLPIHARELAADSLVWMDQFWSSGDCLLVLEPPGTDPRKPGVRNSSWYALALLMRQADGDLERATRTIDAVLATQFDEPNAPYHGTFPRWLGEPHPPVDAVMWRDYDPNWRQFVGTIWALILDAYEPLLPEDLTQRLERSIQLAVLGEPPDRCPPSYTNIALLKAGLLTWSGNRFERPEWTEYGETFGQAVFDLFQEHTAFYEYNSPTYGGTDFYALAFWKNHAQSSLLGEHGAEMEAALWRDVARYYHAGLGNVCGPFSRSYGMNMLDYGAILGLTIWLAVGRTAAPFPDEPGLFEHCHDYCFGPLLAFVGVEVPQDVIQDFLGFSEERLVRHQISSQPLRIATAWLGEDRMIGAESVRFDEATRQGYRPLGDQYHPVTMHWRMPSGEIGWMRLRHEGPVDAQAEPNTLSIAGYVDEFFAARGSRAHYEYTFEIHLPGAGETATIATDTWQLPGLTAELQTPLSKPAVERERDTIRITYQAQEDQEIARFRFRVR